MPNFSEGRDQEVIVKLRRAVVAVEGVKLLDAHSDPDSEPGLSPIGWGQHIRALLTAAAVALSARRHVGAGLLPARLDPAAGAPSLSTFQCLALRDQKKQ